VSSWWTRRRPWFYVFLAVLVLASVATIVFLHGSDAPRLDRAEKWAGVFALFVAAIPPVVALLRWLWHSGKEPGNGSSIEVDDGTDSTSRQDVRSPDFLRRKQFRVPALPDRTIGRDSDIAAVVDLLQSGARLVCIGGSGGVGKTRLAIEVAHRMRSCWPDGVVFVPLADVDQARQVPAAIADALGVPVGDADPMATLSEVLTGRTILLVLDNFEHVVEAAPLLNQLLSASPGLRLLVTSRVALELAGERDYPLSPLPVEPPDAEQESSPISSGTTKISGAVALFLDRASGHDPQLAPTPEELDDIRVICARCDGLPLAVELAAAQLRVRTVAELREALAESMSDLGGGRRDAPSRQRTLRACVGWSVEALPAEQRRFLARLSVFRGGFTRDAAATVTNTDPDDAIDRLDMLIAHSLVHRASTAKTSSRFDLLAPVRAYAAELLGADTAATRTRHGQYYRHLLGPLPIAAEPITTATWRRLVTDRSNVRAAVESAISNDDAGLLADLVISLGPVWYSIGPLNEFRTWLQAVLNHPATSPERRVDALYFDCRAKMLDGDEKAAVEAVEHAQRIIEQHQADDASKWVVGVTRLFLTYEQGDFAQYRDLFPDAEQLAEKASPHGAGIVLPIYRGGLTAVSNLAEAAGQYETAADLALQHDAPQLAAIAINNFCEAAINSADPDLLERAVVWAGLGLESAAMLQDVRSYGDLLAQRGTARLLLGEAHAGLEDLVASAHTDLSVRRQLEAVETALSLTAACAALGEVRLGAMALAAYQSAVAIAAVEERSAARNISRRFLNDLTARLSSDEYARAQAEGRSLVGKYGPRLFLAELARKIEAALPATEQRTDTEAHNNEITP
jgi:predicted ATPase